MISSFGIHQPVRHPMKRVSDDEMSARGLCDIQDPDAVLPQKCSVCGAQASQFNPLRLLPVDRNPSALARAYLYRSQCARCQEAGRI